MKTLRPFLAALASLIMMVQSASTIAQQQQQPDPAALMKGFMGAIKEMEKTSQQPSEQPQSPIPPSSQQSNTPSPINAPGSVGDILKKGGTPLTNATASAMFVNGGELSGKSDKGETARHVLNADKSYSAQIGSETHSGSWNIDEQGRLCLTKNGGTPVCLYLIALGDRLYLAPNIADQQTTRERYFNPASPAIAAAEASSAPATAQGEVASTGSQSATQGPIGNQQAQATTPAQASQTASQKTPQADMTSNAETRPTKTLGEKLFFLTLIGAVVSLVALLIAGMTNNVVVFYDWGDFMMTVFIFVAGLLGSLITSIVADGPNDMTTHYIGWGITGVIMLGLSARTIQLSVLHNRSMAIGIIVGLFKIFLALFSVIFVWGKLKSIFGNSRNALAQIFGVVVLGIFAWVLQTLVNGERVYQKKGWAIAE